MGFRWLTAPASGTGLRILHPPTLSPRGLDAAPTAAASSLFSPADHKSLGASAFIAAAVLAARGATLRRGKGTTALLAESREQSEKVNHDYEIRPLEGKGLGMIALRDFRRGELLLEEKPLMTLRVWQTNNFLAHKKVRQLPEAERAAFWDLADSTGGAKSVRGIVETNFVTLSCDLGGLFVTISRLNHSCCPNVSPSWDDQRGVAVLNVAMDVKAGEELCINYRGVYATRDQRREELEREYHFACQCRSCSLEGEALLRSERNRSRLAELDTLLNEAVDGEREGDLAWVDEIAALIREELLDHPAYLSQAYFNGYQLAQDQGLQKAAQKFLQQAYEYSVLAEGPHSEQSQSNADLLLELSGF